MKPLKTNMRYFAVSVDKNIGAAGGGTTSEVSDIAGTVQEPPLSEYSLKGIVNWPGFMFHGRRVEATKPYMWILRGQEIGMVHDIRAGGSAKAQAIDVSIAADKLRILDER